ncbi:P-loop containing nucleoside triphosphate hydrolase protein [Stemphylium lycopersici]|nr:P-loop containing nucleoside triphosphate hydrolase protein [Stemphylium lycopersici]
MNPDADKKRSRDLSDDSRDEDSDSEQNLSRMDNFKRQCPSTASHLVRYTIIHRVHCFGRHASHFGHEQSANFFDVPSSEAGDNHNSHPAESISEEIALSKPLFDAMQAIHNQDTDGIAAWNLEKEFRFPYSALYHSRHLLKESSTTLLELQQRNALESLCNYLEERLKFDYEESARLAEMGMTSRKHWAILFRPGDIVVTTEESRARAFTVTSCPLPSDTELRLECWTWEFNGSFSRRRTVLHNPWPANTQECAITDLAIYPIRYTKDDIEDRLRSRGSTFWACRRRNYVDYSEPSKEPITQLATLRYMVDADAYKMMHGGDDEPVTHNELSDAVMEKEGPPEGSFVLMLPPTISGFSFRSKKWNTLEVDRIQKINWNKGAFDHRLVLKQSKKDLVKALVTVHMKNKSAVQSDFMEGKGEGLIILLHGGPGTGKTLTAESIAEFVERPLYKVTCGDIGTDPESVEKYLETVLFIGSTWGCVVLLDEADVFLEERTKMDLQRNALVSVFLRVLEYYNGILILTTNRIGSFDEAFKSRVQLALHYPPLDNNGRFEVWTNFVKLLSHPESEVDVEGIREKVDILARNNMNGRQIRNAVNTARQLARYQGVRMSYSHVEQAVDVVDEFEKYVTDVHGHDDEENARFQGLRNG